MRTTLTVDDDLQKRLLAKAEQLQTSYKLVVNDALRRGIAVTEPAASRFEPLTFNMGRPVVDLTKATALVGDLDDQALVAKQARLDRS